jgi:peptidyl-prolyl cis-trans isomerase A (cyclophilin A)
MNNRISKLLLSLMATLFFLFAQATLAAAETIAVLMKTSAGDITLELYSEAAPLTVANFLVYVDQHRYDGNARFYRTVRMDNQAQNNIKIEVIQGGLGMEETDSPLAPIAHETSKVTGILHLDGVISMARLEPGSAASEFFICVNDQPELDFGGGRNPDGLGFAGFGKVIKGMDVVRRIQAMNTDMPEGQALEYTSGQILSEPVVIHQVSRIQNQ